MKLQISILLFFISSFCAAQVTFGYKTVTSFNVDTTQLFAKRDTNAFAKSIIDRIYQDTSVSRLIITGEEILLPTLILTIPSSGNKSIQFKPYSPMNRTSTSVTTINATNAITVNSFSTTEPNTDWVYLDDTIDLTAVGDFQTCWFLDSTNSIMYEIMFFNLPSGGFLKLKKY